MHGSTLARRARRALKAAVLAGVLVVTSFGMAGPSTAQDRDLDVDEIAHSANVKHLANIPRQGPLAEATHSDLAFYRDYAIQGTYAGFTIYDIKNPREPKIVTQFACNGGQGDPTDPADPLNSVAPSQCQGQSWPPGAPQTVGAKWPIP